MTSPRVTTYPRDAPSDDLRALWQATLGHHHDAYSIPPSKFHQILNTDNAKVFVAYTAESEPAFLPKSPDSANEPSGRPSSSKSESQTGKVAGDDGDRSQGQPLGFAITYVVKVTASTNPDTKVKGSLGALLVPPEHQGKGIGSALHEAAVSYLEKEVRRSLPPNTDGTLQLGSTFPRIFPGLPDIEYLQPAKDWFRRRGWTISEPDAIDLYSPLPNDVNYDPFTSEARKHGVEFRHARPADREALMRMEFTEFDSFTVSLPFVLRGCWVTTAHVGPTLELTIGMARPVPQDDVGWEVRGYRPGREGRHNHRCDVRSASAVSTAGPARVAEHAGEELRLNRVRGCCQGWTWHWCRCWYGRLCFPQLGAARG